MSARQHPIPLILGATGVGKSRVAYEVAMQLGDAEILSADARSIFRQMDIGTDKPSSEWRQKIPHHLIDVVEPDQTYSVMDFRRNAISAIEDIRRRSKRVIVVGGSTLYVHALTGKLFEGPSADPELRKKLSARPLDELYAKLKAVDPTATTWIHPNDKQRIVRALEVYELTGLPMSEMQSRSQKPPYDFQKIGLKCERKILHGRIDQRVDEMMEQGLLEEVKSLQEKLIPGMQAYKSNGYKELFNYLSGQWALEEAVRKIKVNTHTHCRRQDIFFKRDQEIQWIDVGPLSTREVVAHVLSMIQ